MHRLLSSTIPAHLPCLALLAIFIIICARSRGEAVSRMVELEKSSRYNDAVRVVQDWMSQHQDDTSHDDFLHPQIAMVYIDKAYHRQSTRDASLRSAAFHVEQALNLYGSKKPEDVDTMLFEIGGAYEVLGNLSQKDKFQFFVKARAALQNQLPLIKGDSYTAYGKTVPLEPLRVDVRKHLASVQEKSTQAGCSVP